MTVDSAFDQPDAVHQRQYTIEFKNDANIEGIERLIRNLLSRRLEKAGCCFRDDDVNLREGIVWIMEDLEPVIGKIKGVKGLRPKDIPIDWENIVKTTLEAN